uniref:Secreted protein n=1 Tax=Panagrellus redivivus TaxID=6233 RepID=A0A7E4VIL2_PANRE
MRFRICILVLVLTVCLRPIEGAPIETIATTPTAAPRRGLGALSASLPFNSKNNAKKFVGEEHGAPGPNPTCPLDGFKHQKTP